MSKSKHNGVDPQDLIDKYGADTARLYTMFTAPPEATLEWNDASVEGSYRFLRRVWNLAARLAAASGDTSKVDQPGVRPEYGNAASAMRREIHAVLQQVDYDYQRMQYNTVVSGTMKMLNALEGFKGGGGRADAAAARECFSILLRCLYPAAPHITQAMWVALQYDQSMGELLDAPWPEVDPSALLQEQVELMLQINGKLRGAIRVPAGASRHEIEAAAQHSEVFVKQAHGVAAKKIIVVPGRLVNLVL